MRIDVFLNNINEINSNLKGKTVKDTRNSIGSNVFFDFGALLSTELLSNGNTYRQWEWTIWLENTCWRLTKGNEFIVGSESHQDDIEEKINELINKSFKLLKIVSQFLDLEIIFSDGYKINTFFECAKKQWVIFLPNAEDSSAKRETIQASCETPEEIRDLIEISKNTTIHENYEALTSVLDEKLIQRIRVDDERLFITCEDRWYFAIDTWDWRVEKNGEYDFGSFRVRVTDAELTERLAVLVGQRIKRVDATNEKMDLRIQIGDQYILKTFASSEWDQWFIDNKRETILSHEVQPQDDSIKDDDKVYYDRRGPFPKPSDKQKKLCDEAKKEAERITGKEHNDDQDAGFRRIISNTRLEIPGVTENGTGSFVESSNKNLNDFLLVINSINDRLLGKAVENVQDSMGANVFIDFGAIIYSKLTKRGIISAQWEWTIWLGSASWRMTKNNQFFLGSDSHRDTIEIKIKELMKNKFLSLKFTSQFLDIEIVFSNGYKITTFFEWTIGKQWMFFCPSTDNSLPKRINIYTRCETPEEIRNLIEISKNTTIQENYETLTNVLDEKLIERVRVKEERLLIRCENELCFVIDTWKWRLEKNGDYHFGSFRAEIADEELTKQLAELVGQRIKRIDATNERMDLRIQIGDHYVLKTFASSEWDLWFIDSNEETILSHQVQANESLLHDLQQ